MTVTDRQTTSRRHASDLPTSAVLVAGLRSVLDPTGRASLALVKRRPNAYAGVAPSEIVRVRVGGSVRSVFCKYGGRLDRESFGHRRGPPYEVLVHREVLQRLAVRTPRLLGAFPISDSGDLGLAFEYLEDGVRLYQVRATAVVTAASWIGSFHRDSRDLLGRTRPELIAYDAAYYRGWTERTIALGARSRHSLHPATRSVAEEAIGELLGAEPCVIHGEYYPRNVLIARRRAWPVDWDTAAIGPGEIDLASITEGWPEDLVAESIQAYVAARWDGRTPARFPSVLDAARVYLDTRWLGDRPEWTVGERAVWRYERLREMAERSTSRRGGNG